MKSWVKPGIEEVAISNTNFGQSNKTICDSGLYTDTDDNGNVIGFHDYYGTGSSANV